MKKSELKKKKLGEVLQEAGLITAGQLDEALTLQRRTKRRLGKIMIDLGYVDERELCQTLSKQLKIPLINLKDTAIEEEALAVIPEETAREKGIIPVRIAGNELTIAMSNPLDWMTIQEMEFKSGMRVNVSIASESLIFMALDKAYGLEEVTEDASSGLPESEDLDISRIAVEGFGADIDSLYKASEFPPVVQIFSKLLVDAMRAGATDLHLEPREKHVQVRLRVDGILRNTIRYPRRAHDAIVARAKALTKIDIANRTMPQEGTNRVALGGRDINIRVSTLPSMNGESVLVNIVEKSRPIVEIGRLGIRPEMRRKVSALLHKGQGLLLISGLKGSGRRTTLYSLLQLIETDTVSIASIGTTSGYSLEKTTEVQINETAGLTMPLAIRAALRHDPDVIATGELKDKESASAAMDAALNGKLVLAIIEAPSAASAMIKLSSYGISSYTIRSAVAGALSQRLLKGICKDCRESLDTTTLTAIRNLPPLENAYTGTGCKKCGGTGHKGRVAIFEFLPMDHNMMKTVSCDINEDTIREAALKSGTETMFDDAWAKAASGDITIDEALSMRPTTA